MVVFSNSLPDAVRQQRQLAGSLEYFSKSAGIMRFRV